MNSLFVGPYRQFDMNGLYSQSLLYYLYRTAPADRKLISRNIYLNNSSINGDINLHIINETEKYADNISTLIQNVPANSVYLSQHINNNICIPILDNKILQDEDLYRLSMCSKVLVDNYVSFISLKPYINNIELITHDPVFASTNLPNINLGIYANTKKMYFIGDYIGNKDLIRDLVISFILFSTKHDNLSLILFLTDSSQKDIQEVQSIVQKVYSDLQITNVFVKVVGVSVSSNINSLISCHMSGNIYLNINDNIRNDLNVKYAEKFNNEILDLADMTKERTIIRNNIIAKNCIYEIPTQSGILNAMDNLSNKINTQNQDKKDIASIIWQ